VKILVKLGLGTLLLAGLSAIVAANFRQDPEAFQFKWRISAEVPHEVKLAPVARGPITRTVEAPGRVEADIEVKISAEVMGKIDALPPQEGDPVREGDLLVQLNRDQYESEVRSAESRVRRLEESIKLTEADEAKSLRDFERNRRLAGRGAVSQAEMIDNQTLHQKDKARLAMARAELEEAKASLKKAKKDLERTTILSPMTGVVSQLLAKKGEVVVIGTMNNAGTVILHVSDPNTMVVRTRIDENSIALVQPGQKALVHFQNSSRLTVPGQVKRISPKAVRAGSAVQAVQANDNEVATYETIISLESPPPQVRLGMSASVEVLVEERDDVRGIPSQAVLHRRARDLPHGLAEKLEAETVRGPGVKDPSRRYHQVVFVNDNGKARCRLVKTGISDEGRVEIVEGLAEGERVITGPYRVFDKLKEGSAVKEAAADDSTP
jgi:HlyD family secretion protein